MLVGDKYYHTIWRQGSKIMMIDQNKLPFSFEIATCNTYQDTCRAIKDMTIRGAGAIGAAAACAMLQAFLSAQKKPDCRLMLMMQKLKLKPLAQQHGICFMLLKKSLKQALFR